MTSRQRLLNTIYRRPIDRVPISLYELCPYAGSDCANFANTDPSYQRLLALMAENTDTLMMSSPVYTYPNVEKVTERRVWREGVSVYEVITLHTPKGVLTAKTRRDDNIFTVWYLEHFLKDINDIRCYQSLDFNCKMDTRKMFADQALLDKSGLIMASIADPICLAAELFSMEDFLVYAITETDTIQDFLDWLWEGIRARLAMVLRHDVKDIMFRIVGPEYATPPYLPNRYFSKFVTQYTSRIAHMVKQAGAIPRAHSHGRVKHALSEFAGAGVMCVDPIEAPPDGDITLTEAKALYGDQFTLMGNIELKALELQSPPEIDALVKAAMDDAKEGGGFILMPTATPINIPLKPKTETNLMAMIDAGMKYGRF